MYTRWYDQYSDLKQLITLLEKVDEHYAEIISQDFLQIIMSKYQNHVDEVIKKVAENPPPRYNRWYDKNYDLHTCIQVIKLLNDEERAELVNELITALYSYITNVDDEK